MGAVPSTPRRGARPADTAEELIAMFVGEKSYPISSEFWKKLLELPNTFQWPQERVEQACRIFLQNNYHTRHLAKILIHMVLSLQESLSATSGSSMHSKAINAAYISSVFLKYIIENGKSGTFEELYLSLSEIDTDKDVLLMGQSIENFVMQGVLNFIGKSDPSTHSYILHHEVLNFILVAMSTQLRSGPCPGPKDVHRFIDAAMSQDGNLVASVVGRLLLNFIDKSSMPFSSHYTIYSNGNQSGVLQRVGSAAANIVLLPYYTFNYLVSSSGEGLRSPLADISLHVLLVLIHYRTYATLDRSMAMTDAEHVDSELCLKEGSCFYDNPYSKALNNASDIEFIRADIEGNAHRESLVRLPFASLFDTIGLFLSDESAVLLLYSFVHGNFAFLEYILVRTDLDILLLPILETLYNASKRTPNQIYMLLIILLILSQDSSFNASIHKLILPTVPWYEERLVHHTSLGSLMVLVLIRTVKYNLSKLRDVYLHTNCLAILANMAPHALRLSSYASQRLVSLFDMLARKYTKLAEIKNDKCLDVSIGQARGGMIAEDMSSDLYIYAEFLRIVLEILNAILTYALPQNPEVVYAIMHRQEVFQPFKNHPKFHELLENVYTVLNFFNSRMDMQQMDGEWSVEKVLSVIIINCRSWRGDGMKIFTQLRFTYEQESHPEEFFIPYVWRLILGYSFTFNKDAINLFPVDIPAIVMPLGLEYMQKTFVGGSSLQPVHSITTIKSPFLQQVAALPTNIGFLYKLANHWAFEKGFCLFPPGNLGTWSRREACMAENKAYRKRHRLSTQFILTRIQLPNFIEHFKEGLFIDSGVDMAAGTSASSKLGAAFVAACICEKDHNTYKEKFPGGDKLFSLCYSNPLFRMHHSAKRLIELERSYSAAPYQTVMHILSKNIFFLILRSFCFLHF